MDWILLFTGVLLIVASLMDMKFNFLPHEPSLHIERQMTENDKKMTLSTATQQKITLLVGVLLVVLVIVIHIVY